MSRAHFTMSLTVLSILALAGAGQALPGASPDPLAPIFRAASSAADLPQSSLFTPKPSPRACSNFCLAGTQTTPIITGSGGTCADAQTSLQSQLQSIARNTCISQGYISSCNLVVSTTSACTQTSPGVFQVKGYATFSCKDNIC